MTKIGDMSNIPTIVLDGANEKGSSYPVKDPAFQFERSRGRLEPVADGPVRRPRRLSQESKNAIKRHISQESLRSPKRAKSRPSEQIGSEVDRLIKDSETVAVINDLKKAALSAKIDLEKIKNTKNSSEKDIKKAHGSFLDAVEAMMDKQGKTSIKKELLDHDPDLFKYPKGLF